MSSRPRLLKKQSSLAILVELERETCESASRPPSETDQGREEDAEEMVEDGGEPDGLPALDEDNSRVEKGDGDSEGGDTDVAVSSEDENEPLVVSLAPKKKSISASVRGAGEAHVSLSADEFPPPPRMSRRLMSMKRRGKLLPMADLTEEFEFYADDVLTVRGEEDDFYVCRVLEDVPESASSFGVAWFNRVADNLYEVSHLSLFLNFGHSSHERLFFELSRGTIKL